MYRELYIPGATVVGVTFKNGVILGAEKRISYGTYVVSKHGKKIFKISANVGAACAGMIADMQILSREIASYVKIREMETNRPMAPNSVAKLMSVVMFERRYAPMLTQVILGGVNKKASVYVLDPLGSVIPDDYAAVGTGTEMAIAVIDSSYREEMTENQARELVTKAIKAGIQRDAASGDGADIMIITQNGIREDVLKFS